MKCKRAENIKKKDFMHYAKTGISKTKFRDFWNLISLQVAHQKNSKSVIRFVWQSSYTHNTKYTIEQIINDKLERMHTALAKLVQRKRLLIIPFSE